MREEDNEGRLEKREERERGKEAKDNAGIVSPLAVCG